MKKRDAIEATKNRSAITLVYIGISLVAMIFLFYAFEKGEEQTIESILISTGEWAPYSGEKLESFGVASAIVSKVLNDIGYEPQYQFMPWPIAEDKAFENEENDGIRATFPYIASGDREDRFYLSDPILTIDYGIFYHELNNPEGANIKTPSDLINHRLIPLAGYEYDTLLKQHLIQKSNTDSTDNLQAFLQLSRRKGDSLIVVESIKVGTGLLEQKLPHLVSHIKVAPFRGSLKYYFLFSKRNPNNLTLRNDFNKQLAVYRKNKTAYKAFQNDVLNNIEMSRSVVLEPFGNNQLIQAFTDTSKNDYVFLPKGSKAIVKSWGSQYLDYHNSNSSILDTLVKVKILNGPLSTRDSILYVDGRTIRLH